MIFLQEAAVAAPPTTSWLEYALVAVLVVAQVGLLLQTLGKISRFRSLLRQPPLLQVVQVAVDPTKVADIAHSPDLYAELLQREVTDFPEVELIGYPVKPNDLSLGIVNTLNRYLLKSRGQVADFTLVKDVVERQSDALEEEINQATPLPLYLGLLGTMIGVIIGVFNMSAFTDAADPDLLGRGIAVLLGGVKIAMIASAVGLLATVLLSLAFRGAKSAVERQKNDFYSLVQSDLLPLVNQSTAASIGTLQSNLMKFNAEFTQNLTALSGVMSRLGEVMQSNEESIRQQKELVAEINRADLAQLSRANVTIWREMKVGVAQLEGFNAYLTGLNGMVQQSQALETRMADLLTRTNQFGALYDRTVQSMELNGALLGFLQSHFAELEKRRDLINNALLHVDDAVSGGFDELRDHLKAKTEAFKSTLLREEDLMSEALKSNRTNLDNLRYLENLHKQMQAMMERSAQQTTELRDTVTGLNREVNGFRRLVESELGRTLPQRVKGWFIRSKANGQA